MAPPRAPTWTPASKAWSMEADLMGTVAGSHQQGEFIGDWAVAVTDGATDAGQIAGLYEGRNELGGYFFGAWTDGCDLGDPSVPR